MPDSALEEAIRSWDGEMVVSRFDRPTGSWIFIAIHSSALGRPTGGTRVHTYSRPVEGLRDAMRLGEGMTHKWAVLGLPYGGAKAVLAVPGPLEPKARRGLLLRYGGLLESLRGAFGTGEDLGTTPEDMALVGSVTQYVHGLQQDGPALDPGPFTARGVYAGLRAALEAAFGSDDPRDRTVLIQGVGDVGHPLGVHLHAAGARILVSDLDEGRLRRAEEDWGAERVAPEAAYSTPCDVYAPCAVGATLNAETIPRLACRVVAGSANNQLATAEDAGRLHERGILYAPDYVINGAGALVFGRLSLGETDLDALEENTDSIGSTLREIFAEARERDESPVAAAHRRVERALDRGAS